MKELQKHVEFVRDEIIGVYNETDPDYPSILDYLNEVLDIEYTCSATLEYIGAKLYVTLGGPNIWVDTRKGIVEGAWGTDRYSLSLPSDVVGGLDFNLEECFNYHKEA